MEIDGSLCGSSWKSVEVGGSRCKSIKVGEGRYGSSWKSTEADVSGCKSM